MAAGDPIHASTEARHHQRYTMSTAPVPPAYPPPSYVPFPDPAQEWRDSTQLSILQDIVQSQQKQLEDQQEILLAQQQEVQGTKDKVETMRNELSIVKNWCYWLEKTVEAVVSRNDSSSKVLFFIHTTFL